MPQRSDGILGEAYGNIQEIRATRSVSEGFQDIFEE